VHCHALNLEPGTTYVIRATLAADGGRPPPRLLPTPPVAHGAGGRAVPAGGRGGGRRASANPAAAELGRRIALRRVLGARACVVIMIMCTHGHY